MKQATLPLMACVSLSSAGAQALLTGDTRLACEALLCLSSGQPPHECSPSLERYFSLKPARRPAFLNLCPRQSSESAQTQATSAATIAADVVARCSVTALNQTNLGYSGGANATLYISDVLPSYCTAYGTSAYAPTSTGLPRYVGDPLRGGFWIEPENYEQALRTYNAQH